MNTLKYKVFAAYNWNKIFSVYHHLREKEKILILLLKYFDHLYFKNTHNANI